MCVRYGPDLEAGVALRIGYAGGSPSGQSSGLLSSSLPTLWPRRAALAFRFLRHSLAVLRRWGEWMDLCFDDIDQCCVVVLHYPGGVQQCAKKASPSSTCHSITSLIRLLLEPITLRRLKAGRKCEAKVNKVSLEPTQRH